MDRQKFAFDKTNFILLAIGMAVIIVGFLLMTGPSSTEGYFEPDIFSVRRIKVAPAVCFFGFIFSKLLFDVYHNTDSLLYTFSECLKYEVRDGLNRRNFIF